MRAHVLSMILVLAVLPACAGPRAAGTARPAAPAAASPEAPEFTAHPLEPDFRKLGEALATFWRAEDRFPGDVRELEAFAAEHRLDVRLTQLSNLSLRSKLYGRVLAGQCDFPHPGPVEGGVVRSATTFEIDATDPKAITVSFDAGTPDGQAYLEEAYRIFSDRFEAR